MRLTLAPALAAMSALAASAVLAAPAAHAETWRGADARGDVRSLELTLDGGRCEISRPEDVPADRRRDLTRLVVDHGADTVTVRLRLREVARQDPDTFVELGLRTPDADFTLDLSPRTRPSLQEVEVPAEFDDDGCGPTADVTPRSCRELRVVRDPAARQLVLTVPRACLDDPRWVRVGARTSTAELVDDEHFRAVYDVWGPRGTRGFGVLPPLGPKVRAS